MDESAIKRRYRLSRSKRICQGDIFRDMLVVNWHIDESYLAEFEIKRLKPLRGKERDLPDPQYDKLIYPYIVVLTQDCDLAQDYDNYRDENPKQYDKIIPSVLVCPAYRTDEFQKGVHVKETGFFEKDMREIKPKEFEKIAKCIFSRYHYLLGDTGLEVPNLVLDFKHYFTMPVPVLYIMRDENHYVASVNEVHREHLSQRFSSFLNRVGLPSVEFFTCDATKQNSF